MIKHTKKIKIIRYATREDLKNFFNMKQPKIKVKPKIISNLTMHETFENLRLDEINFYYDNNTYYHSKE